MRSFTKTLSNFLAELSDTVLQELSESNPAYGEMKSEKEMYYVQLQDLIPSALLSDYAEAQYALATLEINYCYLCGWSYKNSSDIVNPTSDIVLQELSNYEKYRQLQSKANELYTELKAALLPEHEALLNNYIRAWNESVGLEKHCCYSGGINDKARLDKYTNPKNEVEWRKLTGLFL